MPTTNLVANYAQGIVNTALFNKYELADGTVTVYFVSSDNHDVVNADSNVVGSGGQTANVVFGLTVGSIEIADNYHTITITVTVGSP